MATQLLQAATPPASAAPSHAAVMKPFAQASKIGHRQVGSFQPVLGASPDPIGPVALTASGGFVRRWIIEAVGSGGGGTTPGVFVADGPWNLFSLVTLSQPNNNPLVNLSGYNLFLTDIYGGFTAGATPQNDPDYSVGSGNFDISPYLPIEMDPTALGALSDLSSSSGYQLTLLPAPDSTVYSTVPSPLPAVSVNVTAEYWTLPTPVDSSGVPQAVVPPRAGTIQMWNQIQNIQLSAGGGDQQMQLNRMGNELRTVLMVTRSNGARSDAPFPNPARIEWDDVLLKNLSPSVLRKKMFELTLSQTPRPTGVEALFFNEGISRHVGGNGINSLLPTVTDTRFALSGSYGAATAPTLDWVVNDVSRAPLGAVQRTSVGPGSPGYQPPANG